MRKIVWSTVLLGAVILAAGSCGAPAVEAPDAATVASDAAVPADPGPPDAGTGAPDAATDGGRSPKFHIQLDYRFDSKGFFKVAERRATLELAARMWEDVIDEDFPDIPAGTSVRTRNPEQPTVAGTSFPIEFPIDDLLIFVGSTSLPGSPTGISAPSAALNSVTDPTLQAQLQARFEGADFAPWTGWIGFDDTEQFFFDPTPETANDIPRGGPDFLSVALHEIGHVLGVGTAAEFKRKLDSGGRFAGARAVAVYGAPVPMTSDGVHMQNAVTLGGQRVLMDLSDSPGERTVPTLLDEALLEDIGYAVRR